MGLKILTVLYKEQDSTFAGNVLFNSKFVLNDAKTYDTDDTLFHYGKNKNDRIGEEYWVDEALATFDDIYTASSGTFFTLPIYDDVNDATSSTTNRAIDLDDIVKGIALPSSTTKSLLWVQSGGKVNKILVNQELQTIEDMAVTGSTTTTTH